MSTPHNEVKYTPERGMIQVPHSSSTAKSVEVSVTDTGIGIPEADRPRVFERFYRVDKARSREMGGSLSIVRHIIEGRGGQILVEGNQPAGSQFIRLPIASLPATHQTNLFDQMRESNS